MENAMLEGVEIERCKGCKGLWFDQGEEEKLSKIQDAELLDWGVATIGAEFSKDEPIPCPRCPDTLMDRIQDPKQTHITLERCPKCAGTYFDAGEFTDYKNYNFIERLKNLVTLARK